MKIDLFFAKSTLNFAYRQEYGKSFISVKKYPPAAGP